MISTRDCFAYDLIVRETIIDFDLKYLQPADCKEKRKKVIKREFFFDPNCVPENY
jgi:hypothetical protein